MTNSLSIETIKHIIAEAVAAAENECLEETNIGAYDIGYVGGTVLRYMVQGVQAIYPDLITVKEVYDQTTKISLELFSKNNNL